MDLEVRVPADHPLRVIRVLVDEALDGSGKHVAFLDGVVFFEGPPDDRKLIAYGERSVSQILGET